MTTGSTRWSTGSELLMRRFGDSGPAVLMVHGLGQGADIFCPTPGRGLAPWLEEAGYSVHVADLRMRSAEGAADISLQQLVSEDIPALFQQLDQQHPGQPFFVVSHGWGGVLVACALIRQPQWLERIAGLVQVGVRRSCQQRHWRRRLLLDFMWGRVARWLGRRSNTVALSSLGLGRVDISRQLHDEVRIWQNGGIWRDPQDGFDYATALSGMGWPGSLYTAGGNDLSMAHPADIASFARELGVHDAQLVVLQKGTGSSRSYGHTDLLTHPQAATDHFPLILSWMSQRQLPEYTESKEAQPCIK